MTEVGRAIKVWLEQVRVFKELVSQINEEAKAEELLANLKKAKTKAEQLYVEYRKILQASDNEREKQRK